MTKAQYNKPLTSVVQGLMAVTHRLKRRPAYQVVTGSNPGRSWAFSDPTLLYLCVLNLVLMMAPKFNDGKHRYIVIELFK